MDELHYSVDDCQDWTHLQKNTKTILKSFLPVFRTTLKTCIYKKDHIEISKGWIYKGLDESDYNYYSLDGKAHLSVPDPDQVLAFGKFRVPNGRVFLTRLFILSDSQKFTCDYYDDDSDSDDGYP